MSQEKLSINPRNVLNRNVFLLVVSFLFLGLTVQGQIRGTDEPGRMTKADYEKLVSSDEEVPSHYRKDQQRFTRLSTDPAHNDSRTSKSRSEAVAGLEAEKQGLVKGPIKRGPVQIEFYDADGMPWDVKTPYINPTADSGAWAKSIEANGKAIQRQLNRESEDDFSDLYGGEVNLVKVNVILNITYLSKSDYEALEGWLKSNLQNDDLQRIVRVSIKAVEQDKNGDEKQFGQ